MPDAAEADERALGRIREICLAFPGADEAEIQDRPLFRVGRRRFAIFNGALSPPRRRWESSGRSLHFVTDPTERDALSQDNRLEVSPHHGEQGWLALRIVHAAAIDWVEVANRWS